MNWLRQLRRGPKVIASTSEMLARARVFGNESAAILRQTFPEKSHVVLAEMINEQCANRSDLVFDCYLSGAVDMLKVLIGDPSPMEWWETQDAEENERRHAQELNKWLSRFRTVNSTIPDPPKEEKASE